MAACERGRGEGKKEVATSSNETLPPRWGGGKWWRQGPSRQISRGLRTVSPPRWGEDEEAGKHGEEEGVCEARKKIR
jgi:hypothetical protein